MTLSVKTGTVTKDVTSGSHTQAFASELGFTPKGIIFWGGSETATGIISDANLWMGFTNGTVHRTNTVSSNDGTANGSGSRIQSNARCIRFSINGSSTDVGSATCTFSANGFSLVWQTGTNTIAYKINYFAFGGTDITNVGVEKIDHAAVGTQSYTATGFQGDIAFFIPMIAAENGGGTNSGAMFAFGAAMSSSKQFALAYSSAEAPISTQKIQRTDKCIYAIVEAGTDSTVASFVGFTSTGFDINYTTSNTLADTFVMVVKGGAWDIGSFNQKTSTGTQNVTISSTVDPTALLLASYGTTANTVLQDNANFSLGASDGTNEICHWLGDEDAAANAIAKQDYSDTKVMRLIDETSGGGTLLAEADVTSMATAGQFTLDWTTADATAREICYVALGVAAAAGTQFNRTASDTITITDVSTTRTVSALRVPSTDSSTVADSSLTRVLSATRAPGTDTATIVDSSLTRSKTWPRVPSTDSSTVTDASLVRMLSATRTPSTDVLTIGETPIRMLSAFRLPSTDSTTVVDTSLVQAKTLTRIGGPDTTGVSDFSLTRLLSAIRVPNQDTVTVTAGTSTRMLSALRVPSTDTVATTEQTIGGKVYGRIPSTDTVIIADSAITRLLSLTRNPSDTTTVGENLIRILSAFRSTASDNTAVADVSTLRIRSLTRSPLIDTATVVDSSLTRMLQATRVPSQDTITVSDVSIVRLRSLLRLVTADTISVSENITRTQSQSLVRTTSDNTAITDGALSRFLSATRVPSFDTVAIADSSIIRRLQLVRTVSTDTIILSESISSALTTAGVFSRSTSDTVTIAEASLVRLLSSARTAATDTTPLSESVARFVSRNRNPATDSITIADISINRVRSLTRLPTQDTMNIVEASLIRLLSLARSANDIVAITEVQSAIVHSRALTETVNVTEPLLQRIVSASRSLNDIVNISEAVFYQTYHKYVFDTVVVAEQLFSIRESLSGSVTYATPDEVRPLLGNLGAQKANEPIELAIDAAFDEINTKTNRIPPNEWKDTDHNFGIIKKLTRYIAAKEVAIGIKDFDTKPFDLEIEHLFNDLLTYDTTSDASQDIVGSSEDVTFALNEGGVIWSTRYPNLKKRSGSENSTTINPNT